MTLYLDTSVLVSLFIQDAFTDPARSGVLGQTVQVSDFAGAEFGAAVARRVRLGELTAEQALGVFADFDVWVSRSTHRAVTEHVDIAVSAGLVRRLELALRAPDALHLAICERVGGVLFTFDLGMKAAAQTLGIPVKV